MHHCLTLVELREFLRFKLANVPPEREELARRIEEAEAWQLEISIVSYLLCRLLEQHGRIQDLAESVPMLYDLPDQMYVCFQEVDAAFVEYMLRHMRDAHLSLDEDLVQLQNGMKEHRYDKAIRY